MSKPQRPFRFHPADAHSRTFFVTTKTAQGRAIFQSHRLATLLVSVFRDLVRNQKVDIHDFVVMPDHIHILLTIPGELSIEKAMQLIKGGFSFRAHRELEYPREIWQRGFSDVRIKNEESFRSHLQYIWRNPVIAGLASAPELYPYGSKFLKSAKQGLKPVPPQQQSGTTESHALTQTSALTCMPQCVHDFQIEFTTNCAAARSARLRFLVEESRYCAAYSFVAPVREFHTLKLPSAFATTLK
jgi:putative transposase